MQEKTTKGEFFPSMYRMVHTTLLVRVFLQCHILVLVMPSMSWVHSVQLYVHHSQQARARNRTNREEKRTIVAQSDWLFNFFQNEICVIES